MQTWSDCHSVTNPLESTFADLPVFRANVGTLRDDKTKVSRHFLLTRDQIQGKVSGKSTQYKLLWIGNGKGLGGVGIFLTQKWVDKVINISRVSDRMIVNKVLVQRIIISLISDLTVYAPQYGLNNSQKDDFYDILINFFEGQGRKKFQFQQQTLMATGITQKNMRASMEVMVMELRRRRKGKLFMGFVQL